MQRLITLQKFTGVVFLFSLLVFTPRLIHAGERMVVMVKAADGSDSFETSLVEALRNQGHRIIDATQRLKIKKDVAIASALAGQVPEGLDKSDCDYLLAASVKNVPHGSIEDVGLLVYLATANVKLIRVESGEVTATTKVQGKGQGFSQGEAQEAALQSLISDVATRLQKKIQENEARNVISELWVKGVPSRKDAKSLARQLDQEKGVAAIQLRHFDQKQSQYEVTLEKGFALADVIDEAETLPLEITQESGLRLLVNYQGLRSLQLKGVILYPKAQKNQARHLREAFHQNMVAAQYRTASITFMDGPQKDMKLQKAFKAYPDAALFFLPQFKEQKGTLQAQLSVYERGQRTPILTQNGNASSDNMSGLGNALFDGFEKALFQALGNKSKQALLQKAARKALMAQEQGKAADGTAEVLALQELTLQPIFAANVPVTGKVSIGEVSVVSNGPVNHGEVKNLRLVIKVAGLMAQSMTVELKPEDMAKRLPIAIMLDAQKALALTQHQTFPLEVKLTYGYKGDKGFDQLNSALTVYHRNAISWGVSDSVGSFITPRDKAVEALAGDLADIESSSGILKAISEAGKVFLYLKEMGMRYRKDPAIPARQTLLDSVSFPGETLMKKQGDCDDLTVLFASLLEASGYPTGMVMVPGHILPAVRIGPYPSALKPLALTPQQVVVIQGQVFLPIEATALKMRKNSVSIYVTGTPAHTDTQLVGTPNSHWKPGGCPDQFPESWPFSQTPPPVELITPIQVRG